MTLVDGVDKESTFCATAMPRKIKGGGGRPAGRFAGCQGRGRCGAGRLRGLVRRRLNRPIGRR